MKNNTIKINPAHKGEFTAKAKRAGMSVQAYASKVLGKNSSASPATKKQANFARNFAEMGGLFADGGGVPVQSDYPDYNSYQAALADYMASGQGGNPQSSSPFGIPTQGSIDPSTMVQNTVAQAAPQATHPAYSASSIVDVLTRKGKDGSYKARKALAESLGVKNYTGTAEQNLDLIKKVNSGTNSNTSSGGWGAGALRAQAEHNRMHPSAPDAIIGGGPGSGTTDQSLMDAFSIGSPYYSGYQPEQVAPFIPPNVPKSIYDYYNGNTGMTAEQAAAKALSLRSNYTRGTRLRPAGMQSSVLDPNSDLFMLNKIATDPHMPANRGIFQKMGGSINDPNGYLDSNAHNHTPYKVIDSNHITMNGVSQPIVANGHVLPPNSGDYIFDANKVVEHPLYQQGGPTPHYNFSGHPATATDSTAYRNMFGNALAMQPQQYQNAYVNPYQQMMSYQTPQQKALAMKMLMMSRNAQADASQYKKQTGGNSAPMNIGADKGAHISQTDPRLLGYDLFNSMIANNSNPAQYQQDAQGQMTSAYQPMLGSLGQQDAQLLYSQALMHYNPKNTMSPEQRLNEFYDSNSSDPRLQTLKGQIRNYTGQNSPTALFNTSPLQIQTPSSLASKGTMLLGGRKMGKYRGKW